MIWGALAGGFAGTLVLTTTLRAASELHLTRMDIPFLLGTVVTENRVRAKAIGYGLHFVFGVVFAVGYWAVFTAIDESGWWIGAIFGLGHGLFAAGERAPAARAPAHGDTAHGRGLDAAA
jgi:prepilin signal peptidase PulO-like enzyme (type II secretory pathway)